MYADMLTHYVCVGITIHCRYLLFPTGSKVHSDFPNALYNLSRFSQHSITSHMPMSCVGNNHNDNKSTAATHR
jgi:hypothetical protein